MEVLKVAGETQDGRGFLGIFIVLVLVGIVGMGFFSFRRWEGTPPVLKFDREISVLGRKPVMKMQVEDYGMGLASIQVVLRQNQQRVVLVEDSFPGSGVWFWKSGPVQSKEFDLGALIAAKFKVQQGPATLEIETRDHAWRDWLSGNRTSISKEFQFKLAPPRIEVLSSQHNIRQGGTECVLYRVTPDAEVSGVQAGPNFFPGFPVSAGNPGVKFALFAFAYNLPDNAPLKILARDSAGNESVASFQYKLFPHKFRSREMELEDAFLSKVVPEIMSHTPGVPDRGELIKTFVEINNNLRKQNHLQVADFCRQSPPQFLWKEAFVQLSNSKVESVFADHRQYLYQGQRVDEQDHVGFDLSVTQHYPVEAANDGIVVYAAYFGIYGNAVILDHGCGLLSLYGHLSSLAVKPGQRVHKKEIIGRSGATGLAGGDHLHFGLFLQGVPVNPVEWWDAHWINDHVLNRLKMPD